MSIDAMGTHIGFAQQIRDKQAHYLLALKQNQKGLQEEVRDWMNRRKAQLEQEVQTDYVGGRIEKRTTYVSHQLTFIDELNQWPDCQSVIMVECERNFKHEPEKTELSTRFYISSKLESAAYFGTCTRHHWRIENQLHWYLDVVFAEDRQRSRKDHAPENMATLRKMALQLLLNHKGKDSLKKVRKRTAWNNEFLIQVLQKIQT